VGEQEEDCLNTDKDKEIKEIHVPRNGQRCISHSASGNHPFLSVWLTVGVWSIDYKRKLGWKYSLVKILRGTLGLYLCPVQLWEERCYSANDGNERMVTIIPKPVTEQNCKQRDLKWQSRVWRSLEV